MLGAAARGPLKAAVAQYWADHEEEQTRLADQIEITENRIKNSKSEVGRASEPEERKEAQAKLDHEREHLLALQEEVIHRPLWAVTDATVEGLEDVMATAGGSVASFADEAALLSTIAGRYGNGRGVSLGSLNSAHSRGSIFVKRKSADRRIDEPHLVLCQLIQPEPFQKLMGALRVEADGFLSRWLYCDPAPYGTRQPQGGALDASVRDHWIKTLRALLDRCWADKGGITLHLTEASWETYVVAFEQIEADVQAHAITNGTFSQWLGKAANAHMLRIAATFELIGDPNATMISGDSMQRAFTLYGWLRNEARKAMTTTSGDQITADVEREALEWIAKQRNKDRAGRGEVLEYVMARTLQRGPKRFRAMKTEDVEAVLVQLEHGGWLSRTDPANRTDAQTRWQIRWDFEAVWKP